MKYPLLEKKIHVYYYNFSFYTIYLLKIYSSILSAIPSETSIKPSICF